MRPTEPGSYSPAYNPLANMTVNPNWPGWAAPAPTPSAPVRSAPAITFSLYEPGGYDAQANMTVNPHWPGWAEPSGAAWAQETGEEPGWQVPPSLYAVNAKLGPWVQAYQRMRGYQAPERWWVPLIEEYPVRR